MKYLPLLPLFLAGLALAGETDSVRPSAVQTGKFGEVVNTVKISSGPGGVSRDATKGTPFTTADRVSTEGKSRVQIALADGTELRIGANTALSFGKAGRTLQLERGALLLHTPAGQSDIVETRGASVTTNGATLAVSIDRLDRFECAVLSGSCRVGTPGHTPVTLQAGAILRVPAVGADSTSGTFDISSFLANSPLTAGFDQPVPALDAIRAAASEQNGPSGSLPTMTPAATGDIDDTILSTGAPGRPAHTPPETPRFRPDIAQGLRPLSPNGEGSATL